MATIPSFIPTKYHHEIKCILQETAETTWRDALSVIKGDDDYLRVANINGAMKSAPNGVLKSIASREPQSVSSRVLKIRLAQPDQAAVEAGREHGKGEG